MNNRTKRCTIGLLIEGLEGVYQSRVYRSVAATLELHNANLICFSGGSLRISPLNEFEHQQNVLYRLVTPKTLDGIIVSSSIGSFVSEEEFDDFLEGFSGLPIVSIGRINDAIPSVGIYNTTGITALLSHLFEEHDIGHCAAIRGPVGNVEAEERWQAFKAALNTHNREQDEELVFYGDFSRESGFEVAMNAFDRYPGMIDALVCANDEMALGCLDAAGQRGIRIPHDMVITGFDGIEEAYLAVPSLTTVVQPLFDLGRNAAEMVLGHVHGTLGRDNIFLHTKVHIGESCGCGSRNPKLTVPSYTVSGVRQDGMPNEIRKALAKRALDVLGLSEKVVDQLALDGHIVALADTILNACHGASADGFYRMLEEILYKTMRVDYNPIVWQDALEEIHKAIYGFCADDHSRLTLEMLMGNGKAFVGDLALRHWAGKSTANQRKHEMIVQFGEELSTVTDLIEMREVIDRYLPAIPLKRCYITLNGKERNGDATSKLVLSFEEGHTLQFKNSISFPSTQLLPPGTLPDDDTQLSLVVEALSFKNETLGTAIFEGRQCVPSMFKTLRSMISGAVEGISVYQRLKKQADAIASANQQLVRLRAQEQEYLDAIKRELDLAQQIQSGFLPLSLPRIPGWDLATHFQPAQEVAGDFYDLFLLSPHHLVLVIADVCGKSVGAAIFMALVRTLVRALSQRVDNDSLLSTISFVNNYIIQNHHSKYPYMYVTLFYGILESETGKLSYVNAGHPPPAIFSSGSLRSRLRPTGPAVGIDTNGTFDIASVDLSAGDMLFAWTDGVTEVRDNDGELLGEKTVMQKLSQPLFSAQFTIDTVRDMICRHSNNGKKADDDVTMLAIRKLGVGSRKLNLPLTAERV